MKDDLIADDDSPVICSTFCWDDSQRLALLGYYAQGLMTQSELCDFQVRVCFAEARPSRLELVEMIAPELVAPPTVQ
jgi:hypothetical protein